VVPPPPDTGAAPLLAGWAYCYERKGYFPYVSECDGDWELVEAGTPREVENPQMPVWFYCDQTQKYFPYVATCATAWINVPAMPPPRPAAPGAQASVR
jgi:hypothetical protein